jgi:hypothetical protein
MGSKKIKIIYKKKKKLLSHIKRDAAMEAKNFNLNFFFKCLGNQKRK